MARTLHKLTSRQVETINKAGRYSDGGGLYLRITPMGYLNCGKGKPKGIDPITGPYIKLVFDLYATGNILSLPLKMNCTHKACAPNKAAKSIAANSKLSLLIPFTWE